MPAESSRFGDFQGVDTNKVLQRATENPISVQEATSKEQLPLLSPEEITIRSIGDLPTLFPDLSVSSIPCLPIGSDHLGLNTYFLEARSSVDLLQRLQNLVSELARSVPVVAIEGPRGVGKDTKIQLLDQLLTNRGIDVINIKRSGFIDSDEEMDQFAQFSFGEIPFELLSEVFILRAVRSKKPEEYLPYFLKSIKPWLDSTRYRIPDEEMLALSDYVRLWRSASSADLEDFKLALKRSVGSFRQTRELVYQELVVPEEILVGYAQYFLYVVSSYPKDILGERSWDMLQQIYFLVLNRYYDSRKRLGFKSVVLSNGGFINHLYMYHKYGSPSGYGPNEVNFRILPLWLQDLVAAKFGPIAYKIRIPRPSLTVYLYIDDRVLEQRIMSSDSVSSSKREARIGALRENKPYQDKIAREAAQIYPDSVILVDANDTAEKITGTILAAIEDKGLIT